MNVALQESRRSLKVKSNEVIALANKLARQDDELRSAQQLISSQQCALSYRQQSLTLECANR